MKTKEDFVESCIEWKIQDVWDESPYDENANLTQYTEIREEAFEKLKEGIEKEDEDLGGYIGVGDPEITKSEFLKILKEKENDGIEYGR